MTTETKPLSCIVIKDLGRYNFASNEKQWNVQVLMPDGKWLSEKWNEDDEPAIEGEPPSEVIAMIEARIKSYWICTRREETLARIESFRHMFPQMDDAWARKQIESLEWRISSLRDYLIEEEE
jgi:hypothetical protein